MNENELEEYVGKDISKKIIAMKMPKDGVPHTLTGVDLKVGGEGMKSFYDKMLVNEVNKFFNKKKWGKAKVEVGKMAIPQKGVGGEVLKWDVFEDGDADGSWWKVRGTGDEGTVETVMKEFASKQSAEAFAEKLRNERSMEIWTFPITPEIKQKALREGMPMFSVKDKKLSPLAQEYLDMLIAAQPSIVPTEDTKADPAKGR